MDSPLESMADLLSAVGAEDILAGRRRSASEVLDAFEPSLLLLADAEGNLIGAEVLDDALEPHLAESLAIELADYLGTNDACRLGVTTAAGRQLALAVRMPGGLCQEISACLLPRCEASAQRLEKTPTEQIVCGAFAWAAMPRNERLRRRIQHLLAEQDTLKASHAEAIAAIMEEREQAYRQKEEKAVLEKLVQATKAADLAKSEFLTNASHELRTPMTAILGYTDLLADPGLTEDQRNDHLHTIRRNGKILLELINNILDLSKIEAGKMTVKPTDCSPFEVANDLVSLLNVRAVSEGLSLDVDYEFPIPQTIRTDPARLRQIMINLIGNALKFTQQGGVRIAVRCERMPDGSHRLQLAVSDTGIGMSQETVSRLFEPFTQADASTTRNFGGTGLGLAISRRLARMLGGDIEVTSEVDKGSTFTVSIDPGSLQGVPMLAAPPDATVEMEVASPGDVAKEMPAGNLQGRVLLAEDGKDNQRLIGFILKKAGLEVSLAENGRVAYEIATAAVAQRRPFDLILMDMQMPVMDGYESTRRLRQDGWQGPIVALTAHALTGDRQRCLDAGCDGYLTKPIERTSFLAAVKGYLVGDRQTVSG